MAACLRNTRRNKGKQDIGKKPIPIKNEVTGHAPVTSFFIFDIFDLAYAVQLLDDREDEES